MRDLLIQALAMRPDRVVVDELRGGEALDLLWGIREGLAGCLMGIRARSPRDAMRRIETLALIGESTNVTECVGLKHEEILMHDLLVFQQTGLWAAPAVHRATSQRRADHHALDLRAVSGGGVIEAPVHRWTVRRQLFWELTEALRILGGRFQCLGLWLPSLSG